MDAQSDLDSASHDDEPKPFEYAREQGLCIDYTTEPVPFMISDTPCNAAFDENFCDPFDSSITDAVSALIRERLAVNRETALLLKAVYNLRESCSVNDLRSDRRKWILGLKQELPLLQSDHDLDLSSFGSVTSPNLHDWRLPCETVAEEYDAGLEWPHKYLTYPTQCDARLKGEKLSISKNALLYLQEAVRDAYVPEDSDALKDESLTTRSVSMLQPITPPLLPISPLHVPYMPSSPANHLPLASDGGDSVGVEALEVLNQIMTADSLVRKESDSSESMLVDITQPPSLSPLSGACTMVSPTRRAEDLKVEGPLTPPMFSTSPMKKLKSVSFAATADEFTFYEPWGQDRVSGDVDDITSEEDLEFFTEIAPLAENAKSLVDNEQLSSADTTARVDVPNLDFALPVAPWSEYSQRTRGRQMPSGTELEAQSQFLRRIKREDLRSVVPWHGMSIPEREMKWSFLTTKFSTFKLEETLHSESEMKKILDESKSGDIATSSAQVWKCEGLRILDEDKDEEELEPELFENDQDIEALVRKRKLEIEEDIVEKRNKRKDVQHPAPTTSIASTYDVRPQELQERSLRPKCMQGTKDQGCELMFSGFSATSALHRFLQTRGKAIEFTEPKITKQPALNTRTQPMDSSNTRNATRTVEHLECESHKAGCGDENSIITSRALLSFPEMSTGLKACSFIISSKFLQQRSLMRQIEQLFPRAEMVYRDYALPHSPANEADIVISPSTGLVLFSLQQSKQRTLPGQPEKSLVRECIASLQSRYERLIVMVSEQLSREMEELGSSRPEDARDKEALKAIETFAAPMEGEVLIKYIPGGEKALARSMVIEMGKYGLPYGSADIGDIKPIYQETTHEVFLRRAGLNPFAAQAIVALLKKPATLTVPPYSTSPFAIEPSHITVKGLCRFLTMSAEERTHSFQALMGGSRVLQIVSSRLDQEWISAAHGFRTGRSPTM